MSLSEKIAPIEDERIPALQAEIEAQKNVIREACLRMGKAHFDAHKDDPEEELEPEVRSVLDATAAIKSRQAEIRELRGLVLCPECRHEISKDLVFCNYCGYRMKEPEPIPEPEPEPAAPALLCGNCGAELKPGQNFCAVCGTAVPQTPTPEPEPAPIPRRCPNCGAEAPDFARFCIECGTPLG